MNLEGSRDPERRVQVWPWMPCGLTRDQALAVFESRKPRIFVIERFYYDPKTGRTETVGYDRVP